ncbi:class I SAM-dependent methyltransferase [Nocardia wallacei]|uniref:class I SAM-dependent methyltransferase n=1 Tax=Nocardia wallacei TaxID=480035 RepID=UPI0024585DC8|nr:class I SAM-dependent methyltransferase [Nocardia wallacei]
MAALDVTAGATVADVGFGGGFGLQLLLDSVGCHGTVHGIDFSPRAIGDARLRFRRQIGRGRLMLTRAPMRQIPLPSDSFDRCMTVNTVYYLADEELQPSLVELARVVRPSGRLVVGLGDPDYMATLPYTVGLRLRPVDEIRSAICAAGFEVVDHTRVGTSGRAFHVLAAVPRNGSGVHDG